MNLPNKLTLSRIALTAVFLMLVFRQGALGRVGALAVFLAASVTDTLDGWLARRGHGVTAFGQLMDPIADKLLILSAFLAFVQLEIVPAWMVTVILFRELLITGVRLVAVAHGQVLAAERWGKHKAFSQVVAILVILSSRATEAVGIEQGWWRPIWTSRLNHTLEDLMLLVVIMTTFSGLIFLRRNVRMLWTAT